MRFRESLRVGTLILTRAVAGCGQVATPALLRSPAYARQTPQPAVYIELTVDRFMYTKAVQLCNAPLVADVVVGVHGELRWHTTDADTPPG